MRMGLYEIRIALSLGAEKFLLSPISKNDDYDSNYQHLSGTSRRAMGHGVH